MTTRAEHLPVLLLPTRGLPARRFVLSFVLTLLSVAVFGAAFVAGYAGLHAGRVLPGVHVGGVALAGLDRMSAEAALREQLPSLGSGHLTVQFADVQQRITYAEIVRDYDLAAMLDQAFAIGRQGSVLEQMQDQLALMLHGVDVAPQMGWNEPTLERRLGEIAASAYIPPSDAAIVRNGAQYTVVPSVEGRTIDLQAALDQAIIAVDGLSAADTVIHVTATPLAPEITTAQAQAAVERAERVVATDLLVTGTDSRHTISADQLRGWMRLEELGAGEWQLVLEREPIVQWLRSVAQKTDRPPVEASFAFEGERVVAVAGQTGLAVDVETTASAVYDALIGRSNPGPATPSVNLSMTITDPEFTTEEARALAPRAEKVSEWTTKFEHYSGNFFGGNIHVPAAHLDGTVIEPGGKFDFWGLMPDSLAELDGVGPGGWIQGGRTSQTPIIGGGICSVSTTVFNVAARAGLDIGARRNHSYYISRYPVGLDATVFRSRSSMQNLTFFNDTDYPILLRNINSKGKVTMELWTVPTGRTVTFSQPRIENERAPKDFYEYTDTLPAGTTKRIETPKEGFDSWVTRTVKDADGNVIHNETFYSKYRAVHGITLIGRGPDDPKSGTRVER